MESGPFFTQLASLSSHVEAKVNSLKHELSLPIGQNPQRYDIGLNRLKKDIQDLKELSEDLREKLASFSKFSGYLRDAKELVEEQVAGTEKMEQYCAQYGYVIPPSPNPGKATPPEASGDKGPEESSSKAAYDFEHVTPELSIYGQMVLEKKELPILSTVKKAVSMSSHLPCQTPITSRASATPDSTHSTIMGSGIPKPYMLTKDWLMMAGERVEECGLTPDVISIRVPQRMQPPPTKKEAERSDHIHKAPLQAATSNADQMKAVNPSILGHITTPTKPSQSGFTAHLTQSNMENPTGAAQLKEWSTASADPQVVEIATPEEPVLLSQQNPLMSGYGEKGTPEEPVLHYKENSRQDQSDTPEEPVLTCQENLPYRMRGPRSYVDAPKEPVLSYQSTYEKGTPEEPVLSYKGNLPLVKDQDTPEEPVLSYHENLPYRMRGPKNIADIPKEPILSYQPGTPKALSISTLRPNVPRLFPADTGECEVPRTPELSDVTMSILSLTSHQGHPQAHRDHHGHTQHHRNHQDTQGHTQHHRDHHEPSRSHANQGQAQHHRDHQGHTQHHRDHHDPLHAHEDLKESHHNMRPVTHAHHKPGQSFSAAMNQLNKTDDENWRVSEPQQWSNALASQRERAMWDKFQAGVDLYQKSGIPPSPQLSDITQKILGQIRR